MIVSIIYEKLSFVRIFDKGLKKMSSLKYLSDDVLIQSYEKALALNLRIDFIVLLRDEIQQRELQTLQGV